MQENYISLNPANLAREEKFVRKQLYRQRVLEAQGGPGAILMGLQLGTTASVLTYAYLMPGFRPFPLNLATHSAGLLKLGGAFVLFYTMGHSSVMGRFGDSKQYTYLTMNRMGILAGTKPWDK